MACFTMVEILEDTDINREVRKKLGLPLEGKLNAEDTRRVKVEAGILKTVRSVLKLDPGAIIRRKGDKLSVTVQA